MRSINFFSYSLLLILLVVSKPSFAQWDSTGTNIYYNNGNVGVGTSSPSGLLHVSSDSSGASPVTSADELVVEGTGNVGINIIAGDNEAGGLVFGSTSDNFGGLIRWGHDANKLDIQTHKTGAELLFGTGLAQEAMRINSSGKVGIGTTSPTGLLHVLSDSSGATPVGSADELVVEGSGNAGINILAGDSEAGGLVFGSTSDNFGGLIRWGHDANKLDIQTHKAGAELLFGTGLAQEAVRITSTGNVGIGTTTPQSELAVNGTITAKEVEVTTSGWPDFVFEDDFNLRSITEVSEFIKQNKHLPDIPSAKEVEENGLNIGEMQVKLLQKIEEMTLYIIQQNQTIDGLKEEIDLLKKEVNN